MYRLSLINVFIFIVFIYLGGGQENTYVMVHMWGSEDNLGIHFCPSPIHVLGT